MSKRFYLFNHYLMLVSLAVWALWSLFMIIMLPFMKTISMDFLDWIGDMCGWVYPITLAVFAVSSGFARDGFIKYRLKREWEKEDEEENEPKERG